MITIMLAITLITMPFMPRKSTKITMIAKSRIPVARRQEKKDIISRKIPEGLCARSSNTKYRLVRYAKRTESAQAVMVETDVPTPSFEQTKYTAIFTSVVQTPKKRYEMISQYCWSNAFIFFIILEAPF